MANEPGELYFVREQEVHGGALTNYVKIGLVKDKDGRDSFTRLKEHQTGNPRELVLEADDVIKCQDINRIETLMHQTFAQHRISGEWFEFSGGGEISATKAYALNLAAEIDAAKPIFDAAAALEEVEDDGSVIEPTNEARKLAKVASENKAKVSIIEGIEKEIKSKLVSAVSAGVDTKGAVSVSERALPGKFDEEKFKAENADLYAKFIVAKTKMTKRFTQKFETPDLASLDQRFQDFVAASQETVQAAGIQDVNILNELSLKLAHEKALANWEFERATARIRVLCGTHKEITGICTWSRVTKTTETFDAKAFKAAHEDFYGAYVTDGGTTVVQKTAKRKAKD